MRVSERKKRENRTKKKNLKKNAWNFQFVEKQQLADIISLANSKKNKMDSSWTSEILKNYLNNQRKEITHWGTKTILGICFVRNNGSYQTMDSYLLYTRGKKLLTQLSLKKWGWNKVISRSMTAEIIHLQNICTTRNSKGSCWG